MSPVKDQGTCGSCAAFATAAAIETCFKKATGKLAFYSEQQYLDCAYGYEGASACNGAPIQAYLMWSQAKKRLAGSTQLPYRGRRTSCPAKPPGQDIGAVVASSYYTYSGSEDMLKTLVAERSIVIVGLWFNMKSYNAIKAYKKGVFNSCTTGGKIVGGHAIAVVGYGTEGGQDYWLLKNSWGTSWGEKGYIKLRRGVKACDIGTSIAAITCGRSSVRATECEEGDDDCEEEEEGEDGGDEEENDDVGNAAVVKKSKLAEIRLAEVDNEEDAEVKEDNSGEDDKAEDVEDN